MTHSAPKNIMNTPKLKQDDSSGSSVQRLVLRIKNAPAPQWLIRLNNHVTSAPLREAERRLRIVGDYERADVIAKIIEKRSQEND